MSNRLVILFAAVCFLVLLILGPLWAFPHAEDELDEEALDIAAYASDPNTTVEWNGRDGYLTVPAGYSNAESVAADLGDIRGARDVEIIVDDPEPMAEEEPEVVETPVVAALVPAAFNVEWNRTGPATQTGEAPVDLDTRVGALGVATPLLGDVVAGDNVPGAIDTLSPLVGAELVSGTLTVDDDKVRITGVADSQADLDAATEALADLDADIDLRVADGVAAQDAIDDLVALNKIEFETGTAVPTAATEGTLDDIAAVMNQYEGISLEVIGYTDDRGSDAANLVLSEDRAAAVAAALVDRGVAADRLDAEGRGEADPIDSNETDEGRQRNRRVEILAREDV